MQNTSSGAWNWLGRARRFFPCNRWLIVLAAGTMLWRATGETFNASDPDQAFKLLLSAPPPLAQLVFREKLPPVFNRPVTLQGGIKGSTNFALYEVRSQSNGLVVRSLNSTNELPTAHISKVAFTLWEKDFCFLDIGTNAFFYQLEHDRAQKGEVTPSYDAAWFRVSRYAEILNLGLSHIWPGSVRWQDDQFSAQGIADKQPIYVLGSISRRTNGIPCELTVAYSNQMNVAHYRIAYEYAPEVQPLFPARISLFFQHRGSEIEFRSYEVLSITRASGPMARELFSPDRFLGFKSAPSRYLTNDSIYMQLPSGRMLETPAVPAKLALNRADYFKNRYFYAATLFVAAFFFVLMIRTNSSQHQERTITCESIQSERSS